jgi:hypothetical protein
VIGLKLPPHSCTMSSSSWRVSASRIILVIMAGSPAPWPYSKQAAVQQLLRSQQELSHGCLTQHCDGHQPASVLSSMESILVTAGTITCDMHTWPVRHSSQCKAPCHKVFQMPALSSPAWVQTSCLHCDATVCRGPSLQLHKH